MAAKKSKKHDGRQPPLKTKAVAGRRRKKTAKKR